MKIHRAINEILLKTIFCTFPRTQVSTILYEFVTRKITENSKKHLFCMMLYTQTQINDIESMQINTIHA